MKELKTGLPFILFFLYAICASGCRHAWVAYPPALPEPCRMYINSKECKLAQEERASKKDQPGKVHLVSQTYYLFGLYPSEIVVNLRKYCPEGTKTVHQFKSFWDGVLEQLTLTIYSPNTLEIECYSV